MKQRDSRNFLRALWAVCLAALVWGSLISGNELASLSSVLPSDDKLLHCGAYAVLAFLAILAFTRRRGILFALSMIPLGAGLELAQRCSPGRTPDLADALANTLGVFFGMALGILLPRTAASRPPS